MEVKTLISLDTCLSADSVEWCPVAPYRHLLVCGTYQVQERPTAPRLGSLILLSVVDSKEFLERVQTLKEMPGVLDCKWAPSLLFGKVLLAVASALGQLSIYFLNSEAKLEHLTKVSLPKKNDEQEILALSLDWSVGSETVKIAVSDSQGCISVLRLDLSGVHIECHWSAHEYEAWTVHWDAFNSNICYTGGDDSKLRVYDTQDSPRLCHSCNNMHTAGVTSFSSSRKTEHSLLSGSYDEQVLQWDTRNMKQSFASVNTGGGVWRLRRMPVTEDFILAACMYNGFLVLDCELNSVATYTEHDSIAYGADWALLEHGLSRGGTLMATCSFYDHKLAVSLFKNK